MSGGLPPSIAAQLEGSGGERTAERSLFRAVVTQSYLLILQGIALNSYLILTFLLEPKWSQAVQI
jgi:hypothetical protein